MQVQERDLVEYFQHDKFVLGVVIHLLKRIGSAGEQVLPREVIQIAFEKFQLRVAQLSSSQTMVPCSVFTASGVFLYTVYYNDTDTDTDNDNDTDTDKKEIEAKQKQEKLLLENALLVLGRSRAAQAATQRAHASACARPAHAQQGTTPPSRAAVGTADDVIDLT